MRKVRVAPKGMGLNDFVARQEGFFAAEGIEDYASFTRGERLVFQPRPRAEFDEVMAQVARWGFDDHLRERSFERLAHHV